MKIELKNIKHSPSLSEETEAFTANLYIDGVLAGSASNRGHGGPTDYGHDNEAGKELIKKAEQYCKELPPTIYPASAGMKAFEVPMNLEHFIDDILGKHLEEKANQQFRKKMEKAMEMSIVVGIPDDSFGRLTFKSPIDMILVHPRGHDILRDAIKNSLLPNLKAGEKVLNTNIPESIFKAAGLSEDQYVKPEPQKVQALKQKREKKNSRKIK